MEATEKSLEETGQQGVCMRSFSQFASQQDMWSPWGEAWVEVNRAGDRAGGPLGGGLG